MVMNEQQLHKWQIHYWKMYKIVIIYSMKSCPHCSTVKEMMEKKQLEFIEKNINENDDEYQKGSCRKY